MKLYQGENLLNIKTELISKCRHQNKFISLLHNTFNLSLKSNNKNSKNNKRIECLMFKIVCKTPLFTKEI